MKCLIFSDSHGDSRNMCEAISRNPDAEVIFFLGDGLADADRIALRGGTRAWLPVAGNCDHSPIFKDSLVRKTETINLSGQRIVYTHGDLYGVKYGMGGALRLAVETSATIVLFGHTHEPCEHYENGVYLFNPGSIAAGSFGVMLLSESGVLLSHGNL